MAHARARIAPGCCRRLVAHLRAGAAAGGASTRGSRQHSRAAQAACGRALESRAALVAAGGRRHICTADTSSTARRRQLALTPPPDCLTKPFNQQARKLAFGELPFTVSDS
ncbi:unnamed protein product [Urochloa humidicola]